MVERRDGPRWLRDDDDDDNDDNDDSVKFANVDAKEPTVFSLYSLHVLADCFWIITKTDRQTALLHTVRDQSPV